MGDGLFHPMVALEEENTRLRSENETLKAEVGKLSRDIKSVVKCAVEEAEFKSQAYRDLAQAKGRIAAVGFACKRAEAGSACECCQRRFLALSVPPAASEPECWNGPGPNGESHALCPVCKPSEPGGGKCGHDRGYHTAGGCHAMPGDWNTWCDCPATPAAEKQGEGYQGAVIAGVHTDHLFGCCGQPCSLCGARSGTVAEALHCPGKP